MSNLTKKTLAASVTELLKTKSLDRITIKEITDRCGLTRNAFYYHFSDVYELLGWMLTSKADEIIKDFGKETDWEKGFEEGLTFLYENKAVIYHIYRSLNREFLEKYLDRVVSEYALKLVRIHTAKSSASKEAEMLVADFYKNAFVGAVMRWIDRDMNVSGEKLAKTCDIMLKGTVDAALKSAEEVIRRI